jgi:hypothetical protein
MRMPSSSERIRMYSADTISQKAIAMVAEDGMALPDFQPQGTY